MNFYSIDKEVQNSLAEIFNHQVPNDERVIFSVSYPNKRKMSTVLVQVENAPILHALIFFYTRSLNLYDTIKWENRRFQRLTPKNGAIVKIKELNKFILDTIPQISLYSPKRLERIREPKR